MSSSRTSVLNKSLGSQGSCALFLFLLGLLIGSELSKTAGGRHKDWGCRTVQDSPYYLLRSYHMRYFHVHFPSWFHSYVQPCAAMWQIASCHRHTGQGWLYTSLPTCTVFMPTWIGILALKCGQQHQLTSEHKSMYWYWYWLGWKEAGGKGEHWLKDFSLF